VTGIDRPSSELTVEAVQRALRTVHYPGLTRDLVSFGMVKHVSVCDGRVRVQLGLRTEDATIPARLEAAIAAALRPLDVVSLAVDVGLPEARATPTVRGATDPWADQVRLRSVRHVIAVGAGKGGVGKSTVAVNLALALARIGLATGLLDADIYGPSVPTLLGIDDGASRARLSPEKHILPLEAHGLPIISFGFFLGEQSPAVWRGPMVSKAVKQFARGVAWPPLDVLVVDLPPGTGDIPLSLAQAVELSGAVVVTQPSRIAAAEARKAAAMFRTLDVPMLGIVENMSGVFGSGAGGAMAGDLEIPLLGQVPFDREMIAEGDAGRPTVVVRPCSAAGAAFTAMAHAVADALAGRGDASISSAPLRNAG
jgi:ATP-binding protein involved in chromosome partitioning